MSFLEEIEETVHPVELVRMRGGDTFEISPGEWCSPGQRDVRKHTIEKNPALIDLPDRLADVKSATGFRRAEPFEFLFQFRRRTQEVRGQFPKLMLPGDVVTVKLVVPRILPDKADKPAVEGGGHKAAVPLADAVLQLGSSDTLQVTKLCSGRSVTILWVSFLMNRDLLVLAKNVKEFLDFAYDLSQE